MIWRRITHEVTRGSLDDDEKYHGHFIINGNKVSLFVIEPGGCKQISTDKLNYVPLTWDKTDIF